MFDRRSVICPAGALVPSNSTLIATSERLYLSVREGGSASGDLLATRNNLVCRPPCGRGLNACYGPRVVERIAVINAMACLMQEPSQAIAQARKTSSELLHLIPILGEVERAHGEDAVNHPRLTSLSTAAEGLWAVVRGRRSISGRIPNQTLHGA